MNIKPIKELLRTWSEIDLRSFMLFRLLLGLVIIYDLAKNKFPFIDMFYLPGGIINNQVVKSIIFFDPYKLPYQWSLLHLLENEICVTVFFSATMVFIFLYAIGYKALISGSLGLIGLWSFHQRTPMVVSGPDAMLICYLFWGLFIQYAIISKKIAGKKISGLFTAGLLLQICCIYFFNAWLKDGETWKNGSAISYALMEDLWVKNAAYRLAEHSSICTILSYLTIFTEYLLTLLIISPFFTKHCRTVAIIILLVFHFCIFVFLEVGLFHLIAPVTAAVLLPPGFWNQIPGYARNFERWFKINPLKNYRQLVNIPVKIVFTLCLSTILIINSFHLSGYNQPGFVKYLKNTTLFSQDWGMYTPDPTSSPAWYKVTGLTERGTYIDLRSGNPASDDLTDLVHYQSFPLQVFVYLGFYYPFYGVKTQRLLAYRWAEHEKTRWNRDNSKSKVVKVYLLEYRKKIIGTGKATPVKKRVLYPFTL